MCGIVGYIGQQKAVPILINGLKTLEYRGYDSAGLAVLSHKEDDSISKTNFNNSDLSSDSINNSNSYKIDIVKDKGRVKNLEDDIDLSKLTSTIGIAHTRWATHGIPSKLNAHPHLDNSKQFAVVHNGIIENYNEIKAMLLENGYTLFSQTDTEVIPNLIHYNYKKLIDSNYNNSEDTFLTAVSTSLKDLKGSYAIEIISSIFPDEIIVARKDSPLVIGSGNGENYIASDIPAILSHTNKFYFLGEQEIAIVKKNAIKFYDLDLNIINNELKSVEWDAISSEKNGYEDYMLKEINEQSKAIRETIGSRLLKNQKVNLDINIDFSKINKIFIVACGTAMHAGLAVKYSFEHFCKIPTEIDMASEFRYRNPLIDANTLCIFISQSGETADTIAALKLAKSNNCKTIAIVNVLDSSITRIADYTLYTHAGPEIAVASTKAYTCQIVLLNILAAFISEQLINLNDNSINNKSGIEDSAQNKSKIEDSALNKSIIEDSIKNELELFKENILSLPKLVEETIKNSNKIKQVADTVFAEKDIFFIGRGTDYSVSMEGSLKLKEVSYIHSEAYAAGELKHGPIALIEKNTTVVGIITNPTTAAKTLSNIEEVITRGAKILLLTNQNELLTNINNSDSSEYLSIINLPTCSPMLSPILSVIPLQLFAYYIAKDKELDVDKPRNLAKSVTVE